MTRPDRAAGFSLVEALAALAVLGLVSLMLMAGLASAGQAWRRTVGLQTSDEGVAGAQRLVRERLEHAYPAALFGGSQPEVDFRGQGAGVEFLAPAPEADGPHALRRYTLAVLPGGELALSWRSELSPDPPPPNRTDVLLRGVQALRIDYFGAGRRGAARAWTPRWIAADRPPELVRIVADFPPGDPRTWPTLIVRPAADVDDACMLRAGTAGCRGRL